ncbi:hypothetical protein QYE76_012345 [Lolium multiflorum]|uniref:Retrotransposon Copia-like N-terminal domain-containing protein n=1 Tax=Lolium multiflorum TaxID=4521 RepID=A0AAD8U0I5_LOLMU|nr:hypothetical protein QYE76_012345 [Lolium multiflorum]
MTSAASLPASAAAALSAAAASLPVASSTSTTPAMTSSSTTATVSPFLAALLAGTAPPPLVQPPISTRPAGSLFTNGVGWPFSALVSPHAPATSVMASPLAPRLSGSPAVVPSACYTLAPVAPASITASSDVPDAPGAAAFQPPPAGSAPLVPYGAGLYGRPLFYGMPPFSYGLHSPPPPTTIVDTALAAVPAAVPNVGHAAPATPFHFAHLLTVKLNADNYLLWRAQVLPLLRSHYLEGFVDGSLPCPPAILQVTTADGAPMVIPNTAHRLWVAQDQAILGAIQSLLTPSVAGMVVFATSSRDAWGTLDSSFSSQSMARSMAIRTKLGEIKKLDSSISTYYNKVKEMADILSSIGQPLRDEEFTSFILNGLDEDYEALVENINGRDTPPPPRELYARLLNTEQRRLKMHPDGPSDVVANAAYRGGGRDPQQPRPQGGPQPRQPATPPRPNTNSGGRGRAWQCPACGANVPCQLCGIEGHLASRCHRRFKQEFLGIGNDGRGNEKQAALATQGSTLSYPVDPTWYMDTGATDHLTHDRSHLTSRESYTGHDQVLDEVLAFIFWMILLWLLPLPLFTLIRRCLAWPMQRPRSSCRCPLMHLSVRPRPARRRLSLGRAQHRPCLGRHPRLGRLRRRLAARLLSWAACFADWAAALTVAPIACDNITGCLVTCDRVAGSFASCDHGSSFDRACTCALLTIHTRSRSGISRPKERTDGTVAWLVACLSQAVADPTAEPRHYSAAMQIPHWRQAMDLEYRALLKNNTWSLVPPRTEILIGLL